MPLLDSNGLADQMVRYGIGAICIDTSTYEKNAFAFDKGLLAQCPSIRESGLRLLIVDVVLSEVRKHVSSKVDSLVTELRRTIRASRQNGLVDKS